jgi:hypothetical protein
VYGVRSRYGPCPWIKLPWECVSRPPHITSHKNVKAPEVCELSLTRSVARLAGAVGVKNPSNPPLKVSNALKGQQQQLHPSGFCVPVLC